MSSYSEYAKKSITAPEESHQDVIFQKMFQKTIYFT